MPYRAPISLFASRKNEEIQNIYDQVQEEDLEWYNSLSKLLGEEVDVVGMNEEAFDVAARSSQTHDEHVPIISIEEVDDEGDLILSPSIEEVIKQQSRGIQSRNVDDDKDSNQSQRKSSIAKHDDDNPISDAECEQQQKEHDQLVKSQQAISSKIVQLNNKYSSQCETVASLSYFIKRGYTEKEVLSLRPQVVEFIVEDNIPKPRRGIPNRWIRDLNDDLDEEDLDWVVVVMGDDDASTEGNTMSQDVVNEVDDVLEITSERGKSEPQSANDVVSESRGPFSSSRIVVDSDEEALFKEDREIDNNASDDIEQSDRVPSGAETFKRRRSEAQQMRVVDSDDQYDMTSRMTEQRSPRQSYYNDDKRSRTRRSRRQNVEQRKIRPKRTRELVINNEDESNDDPPPNKFWMDLPTFREFLRTEARLRMKILGPDWKDSIMDESRWRFDLYRRWLYLLNDGVGENPLYEYGDRPRQPRRRRSSRKEGGFESSSLWERPIRSRMRMSERDILELRDEDDMIEDSRSTRDQNHKPSNRVRDSKDRLVTKESRDSYRKSSNDTQLRNEIGRRPSRAEELDDQTSEKETLIEVDDGIFQADSTQVETNELKNERPRQRSREEMKDQKPRRGPGYEGPTRRKAQKWKDFGDLENQLINGRRGDEYAESRDTRRRGRASKEFNEDY